MWSNMNRLITACTQCTRGADARKLQKTFGAAIFLRIRATVEARPCREQFIARGRICATLRLIRSRSANHLVNLHQCVLIADELCWTPRPIKNIGLSARWFQQLTGPHTPRQNKNWILDSSCVQRYNSGIPARAMRRRKAGQRVRISKSGPQNATIMSIYLKMFNLILGKVWTNLF